MEEVEQMAMRGGTASGLSAVRKSFLEDHKIYSIVT
jgi:hypothetical protein